MRVLVCILFVPCLALITYLGGWAIWYRVPATPASVVDLRSDKKDPGMRVSFCAALADNPHGFPGHCYVVFAGNGISYVPTKRDDQIRSLYSAVDGTIVFGIPKGNDRNLDRTTVMCDREMFERARREAMQWSPQGFKVGERDCVQFTNNVARTIGLNVPQSKYKFPQDYLRELKELNRPVSHALILGTRVTRKLPPR